MSMRISLALAVAATLTIGGCSSSDDGIEGQIRDLESLFQDEVDVECDCFSELGYASKAECVTETYEPLSASEEQCLLDAYALDEAGSAAYLDCLYGAESLYYQCVQANLDCADDTSTDTCNSDYASNVQMCELPSVVQEAASACFPS